MIVSIEWIKDNLIRDPDYPLYEDDDNSGKVLFKELDERSKKKILNFINKLDSCMTTLYKQGFLERSEYKSMLYELYCYCNVYLNREGVWPLINKIDDITYEESEELLW